MSYAPCYMWFFWVTYLVAEIVELESSQSDCKWEKAQENWTSFITKTEFKLRP